MRHRSWTSTLAIVVTAIISGAAMGQAQMPHPYAGPSTGPVMAQVNYEAGACGACMGSGCGICGGGAASACDDGCACSTCDGGGGSACGCGSNACGGSCLSGLRLGGHVGFNPLGNGHHGGYATQHFGQKNGPFGGAGCCTPMWYDFHIEWMALERENVGDNVDLMSLNAGGPVVLSTDDLDFDVAHGFRATYAWLLAPSTNVEASYFGTFDWDSAASVNGNANLYSVFSKFGTDPIDTSVNPPVIGFPETVDMANFASIDYSSELHNAEINVRRRWVSANCLLHGSYLAGARYVSLNEDFVHRISADSGGAMDYRVNTQNDIWGAQIGGDTYVCLTPRFKLGAELEAGLYGNGSKSNTRAVWREGVDGGPQSLLESEEENDVAFVAELGAIGTFRLTPRTSIRGGYQLLYLDGVALAGENFNVDSPFTPRQALLNNNGNVLYHGATLGLTCTW